jgi:hypothetical protein
MIIYNCCLRFYSSFSAFFKKVPKEDVTVLASAALAGDKSTTFSNIFL